MAMAMGMRMWMGMGRYSLLGEKVRGLGLYVQSVM